MAKEGAGLVKSALIGAGIGAGLTVTAAVATYGLFRTGEENGVGHIIQLAQSNRITVDRVPRLDITDEHLLAADKLREVLRRAKIIIGGDSQTLPTGNRYTESPDHPDTTDEYAADALNALFNVGVTRENYAEPGLQSRGLLAKLRDRESPLRKALIASTDPTIFGISIGPNDLQEVVSDPSVLENTIAIGASNGGRNVKEVIIGALNTGGTLLSLARGYRKVGQNLEDIVPLILQEIDEINRERVEEYGREPILATGIIFPADFGEAHAISVGQPGVLETRYVELNHPKLRRMASMVSHQVGHRLHRGIHAKGAVDNLFFVSSQGVPFPKPFSCDESGKPIVDQHFGPEGQRVLGGNFAAALVDWVYRRYVVDLQPAA